MTLAGSRATSSRRARGDDVAAVGPAAGAHVDEVVGRAQQVEVVVDDDDGGAGVEQAVEHADQGGDVERCSPVEGSSKTYRVPRWLQRSRDAMRSRCDSPPDSDGVGSPSRR